jgi:hypothetical protein
VDEGVARDGGGWDVGTCLQRWKCEVLGIFCCRRNVGLVCSISLLCTVVYSFACLTSKQSITVTHTVCHAGRRFPSSVVALHMHYRFHSSIVRCMSCILSGQRSGVQCANYLMIFWRSFDISRTLNFIFTPEPCGSLEYTVLTTEELCL